MVFSGAEKSSEMAKNRCQKTDITINRWIYFDLLHDFTWVVISLFNLDVNISKS